MKGDFSRWTFQPAQHYHGVLKQQGRVDVEADWNEQGAIVSHRVETETMDVVGQSGAPVGDAGFLINPDSTGKTLLISAGRAYVDGILCENSQAALPITSQPNLPGFALPTAPGIYVAYLKVWLRHVTALDDPTIREDALGGPDTCTRAKTIWQAGLLAPQVTGAIACSTTLPEWTALTAASTGTLAARAEPDPTASDPCLVPAKAGYRSLENQLYRVEIHAGAAGAATYKWSRENGSIVTTLLAASTNALTVTSTGRDAVLGFATGQWVEITDDTHELNFQPGTLVKITGVQSNVITVDTSQVGPIVMTNFPLNPRVRRWEGAGAVPAAAGNWINLENGVQVEFSAGSYTTGDYWMIPARTLKANVDWPLDAGGSPLAQPPLGIDRHFCKLAVLTFSGAAWSVSSTCLATFPPLTSLSPAGKTGPGIHINGVRLIKSNIDLLNDSDIPVSLLADGIGILCDEPVAPSSIKRPTCFVSVELPFFTPATATLATNNATLAVNTAATGAALALNTPATPAGPAASGAPAGTSPASTGAGSLAINPLSVALVNPLLGFQPLILVANADFNATSQSVEWNLGNPALLAFLQDTLTKLQAAGQSPRLLAHLTVKGRFIWGPNDTTAQSYVAGEAFGIPRTTNTASASTVFTNLRFPSGGNGDIGTDFEMWFWLVLPATLVSLTFTPNPVASGATSTGMLTLSSAAPAGGALVTLVPNNPQLASIPVSATIPAGQTTVTFPVTKPSSSVPVSTLQVTATYQRSTAVGVLTIDGTPIQ